MGSGTGWHRERHTRSFADITVNLEVSTEHFRPFSDQLKSEAISLKDRLGIKAFAIIVYTDTDTILCQI
jgi:hypothetical protein